MDLGLNQLTDDQLLELMQEACREMAARDPYVRDLAQHTITSEAERLTVKRAMLKEAVTALAGSYIEQIRAETFKEVREGVRQGAIRLLTAAQEARVAVESTLEAKIKLIDETVTAIQKGTGPAAEPAIQPQRTRNPRSLDDVDPRDYAAWVQLREQLIQEEEMRRVNPFFIKKPPKAP